MTAIHAARHRPAALAAAVAAVVLVMGLVSACAPESAGPTPSTSGSPPSATPTSSPSSSPSSSPTAPPTAEAGPPVPTDCRAILSEAVLAELGETPLNDASLGEFGVQPDGSLTCLWRDPRADTTSLFTTISRLARGPALDLLNGLADTEGFTCYAPDGGTRCEKTFPNPVYPVTDGRTLFWREGLLIDTTYSNLSPSGYTSSIVAAIWP